MDVCGCVQAKHLEATSVITNTLTGNTFFVADGGEGGEEGLSWKGSGADILETLGLFMEM